MTISLYNTTYDTLPESIPVFPLHGVLLLPGGNLPLNVFESRYIKMCDDALRSNRLIGIIQPRKMDSDILYPIGCVGKIVEFTETPDGRYEITLKGINRFTVAQELEVITPYKQVKPDWSTFDKDMAASASCLGIERDKLNEMLKKYFDKQGMVCDWDAVAEAPDRQIMSCLAMACPFEPAEKQAILEQKCCHEQAKMFIAMLEMELYK